MDGKGQRYAVRMIKSVSCDREREALLARDAEAEEAEKRLIRLPAPAEAAGERHGTRVAEGRCCPRRPAECGDAAAAARGAAAPAAAVKCRYHSLAAASPEES